jgi:hypothetical protein
MGCRLYFVPEKTVFLGQPLRTPEEQVSTGATICVVTHAGTGKNIISMVKEGPRSDWKQE